MRYGITNQIKLVTYKYDTNSRLTKVAGTAEFVSKIKHLFGSILPEIYSHVFYHVF
jgi:hypothetical protein